MPDDQEHLDVSGDDGNDVNDLDAIAPSSEECEIVDPEEFGLPPAISVNVYKIIVGFHCPPMVPEPEESSESDCQSIAESNLRPKEDVYTIVFVLKNGIYDAQEGEFLYQAFKDACSNKFPQKKIQILGIQLQPIGLDEGTTSTEIQARPEITQDGSVALRIHNWSGKSIVISRDKKNSISLEHGDQILVDPETFKLLEAMSFDPNSQDSTQVQKVIQPQSGCNILPQNQEIICDPLSTILIILILLKKIKDKIFVNLP